MEHRKALDIAMQAHSEQKDKSGAPYIHHPVAVAALVRTVPTFSACSAAQQEAMIQGALLHDVVEDTEWTVEEIKESGINELTIDIVKVITHAETESREEYISRVVGHPLARIIKVADITHNTDPERLILLPAEKKAKLITKYSKDIIAILREHPDDAEWLKSLRPELFV